MPQSQQQPWPEPMWVRSVCLSHVCEPDDCEGTPTNTAQMSTLRMILWPHFKGQGPCDLLTCSQNSSLYTPELQTNVPQYNEDEFITSS